MLRSVNPEAHETLVPVHWSQRQDTARRLLAAAERIGFEARVVRTGRGGYIVPAEVELEARWPGIVTGEARQPGNLTGGLADEAEAGPRTQAPKQLGGSSEGNTEGAADGESGEKHTGIYTEAASVPELTSDDAGDESPADRPQTQRQIVTQAFTEHPELLTLPVREVARRLGVQPATVSKTRKAVTEVTSSG